MAPVVVTVPAPSFGLFEGTVNKFAEISSGLALFDLEGGLEGYDAPTLKVDYAFFLHAVGVEIALVAIYAIDAGAEGVLDLGGVAQGAAHLEVGYSPPDVRPCLRGGPWPGTAYGIALELVANFLEEGFFLLGVLRDYLDGGSRGRLSGDRTSRSSGRRLGGGFALYGVYALLEGVDL